MTIKLVWIFLTMSLFFATYPRGMRRFLLSESRGGQAVNEREMREKPVLSILLTYSLPMVISMLVNSLYNIVDTFFVAQLGEDAVTALSLIFPLQNLIISISVGFGIGINAVISFCLGAGRTETAHMAATHGIAYACIHTVILTALGLFVMPWFLRCFTSSEAVLELSMTYGTIVFDFTFAVVLGVTFEKMFQAVGRMQATMVSLGAGCLTNIILDPLLIFGIGPFPAWGIAGAAVATGLGQFLSLVIYLMLALYRPLPVRISFTYRHADFLLDRKMYAIGIPATLNLALPSVLIGVLNGMLAAFSQMYVVILGIYYKLQTFLYLPANGIIQGLRPLLGYNYGAKEYGRVRALYGYTIGLTVIIMAIGTVLAWTFGEALLSLFTTNDMTMTAGATALRYISLGFIVSAVSITTSGAMEGLGRGGDSLLIMACRYALVMIPLAYLGTLWWGPVGVWHSFWVTEVVSAIVSFVLMKRFFLSIKKRQLSQ